jgi:hypothetical protein
MDGTGLDQDADDTIEVSIHVSFEVLAVCGEWLAAWMRFLNPDR